MACAGTPGRGFRLGAPVGASDGLWLSVRGAGGCGFWLGAGTKASAGPPGCGLCRDSGSWLPPGLRAGTSAGTSGRDVRPALWPWPPEDCGFPRGPPGQWPLPGLRAGTSAGTSGRDVRPALWLWPSEDCGFPRGASGLWLLAGRRDKGFRPDSGPWLVPGLRAGASIRTPGRDARPNAVAVAVAVAPRDRGLPRGAPVPRLRAGARRMPAQPSGPWPQPGCRRPRRPAGRRSGGPGAGRRWLALPLGGSYSSTRPPLPQPASRSPPPPSGRPPASTPGRRPVPRSR